MLKYWLSLCVLLISLFLTGCSAEPSYLTRKVVFNDDLSGTFTIRLAFTPTDYSKSAAYYGHDPASEISSLMAEAHYITDYTHDVYEMDGLYVVQVVANFHTLEEYYSYTNYYHVDLDDVEYPDTATYKDDDLFRRRYIHEGTWLSSSSQGKIPDNWSDVTNAYTVELPGEIVSTNGTILDDGHTVMWPLTFYNYTPYRLVTEVRRITTLDLEHHIDVERNLEGNYTLRFGFAPAEYDALMAYTGTEATLATELAERMGWDTYSYTYVVEEDNNKIWVAVSVPFENAVQLQTLYSNPRTSSGTSMLTLSQSDNTYHLTATPFQLFNDQVNERTSVFVALPGEVTESNGILVQGNQMKWDGNVTLIEMSSQDKSIAQLSIVAGFMGVTIGTSAVGVVGLISILWWRRSKQPAVPSPTAVPIETPTDLQN